MSAEILVRDANIISCAVTDGNRIYDLGFLAINNKFLHYFTTERYRRKKCRKDFIVIGLKFQIMNLIGPVLKLLATANKYFQQVSGISCTKRPSLSTDS